MIGMAIVRSFNAGWMLIFLTIPIYIPMLMLHTMTMYQGLFVHFTELKKVAKVMLLISIFLPIPYILFTMDGGDNGQIYTINQIIYKYGYNIDFNIFLSLMSVVSCIALVLFDIILLKICSSIKKIGIPEDKKE
jgi:hypothetical protein